MIKIVKFEKLRPSGNNWHHVDNAYIEQLEKNRVYFLDIRYQNMGMIKKHNTHLKYFRLFLKIKKIYLMKLVVFDHLFYKKYFQK